MAITFRNLTTGEEISVSNIKAIPDGKYKFSVRGKGCGTKFLNRNVCLLRDEDVADGTILTVADGWEAVGAPKARAPRKPRAPKAEPTTTTEPMTTTEPNTVEPLPVVNEPSTEPVLEPTTATAATMMAIAGVKAKSLAKKYGEMAKDIIENTAEILKETVKASVNADDVNKIVDGRMTAWEEKMRSMQVVQTIEVKQPTGITKQMTGVFSKGFKVYVNLVGAKKPLYFYGPAGCGKSYMAKQIANGLGLDYYETSQAMFAHDLKGYGDAKGEYVSTPFYKAFSKGGVFFLDEVDASAPEALVVLNNAIANGRFDFPVIGMIEAHPNFRVIAAGNTRMTGATLAYTARQCQDTSFKNRFFFELVGYDERIELALAGGDKNIVEFAHDIRKAARETNILQLCSYRQISDMATLLPCVEGDLKHIIRGSVLQEKEVDEANILYQRLEHKNNPWAKAMAEEIEEMKKEEVW